MIAGWSTKRRLVTGLVLLSIAPLVASAQSGDPDKLVTNGGVMVKGWTGRLDPQAEKQGRKLTDAKFFPAGDGMHVTSGPPAAFWSSSNVGSGQYSVKATFTQTKAPAHPEAYGLFIGGSKLEADKQNYLYCVVFGTGMFSVKHRFGSEVHTLVDRKVNAAIHQADASGQATNELTWKVDASTVSCLINGTSVASFPKADVIGDGKLESTDGIYGIRVNHNLDVHIAGFAMSKQ